MASRNNNNNNNLNPDPSPYVNPLDSYVNRHPSPFVNPLNPHNPHPNIADTLENFKELLSRAAAVLREYQDSTEPNGTDADPGVIAEFAIAANVLDEVVAHFCVEVFTPDALARFLMNSFFAKES